MYGNAHYMVLHIYGITHCMFILLYITWYNILHANSCYMVEERRKTTCIAVFLVIKPIICELSNIFFSDWFIKKNLRGPLENTHWTVLYSLQEYCKLIVSRYSKVLSELQGRNWKMFAHTYLIMRIILFKEDTATQNGQIVT